MQFEGASAVVSGGASGLGAATARRLADRGTAVVVLDRDDWAGAPVPGARLVRGDVTVPADVAEAIAMARSIAPLRMAISCAGVGSAERVASRSSTGVLRAASSESFERVVAINLIGTFHLLSQAAAAIAASHDEHTTCGARSGEHGDDDDGISSIGAIVTTSSIAAFEGQVGQAAYAASKAAVVALTFTAARDLAPLRIRVNGIAPGLMATPLVETIRSDVMDGLVDNVVHPRRAGRPAEFASLVIHLLENEYLNGETIRLDAASRLPYSSPAG